MSDPKSDLEQQLGRVPHTVVCFGVVNVSLSPENSYRLKQI